MSTQHRDAEVLVAGGGPAGAATAMLLARRGHDVLLLDKAAFPREKACAEFLSPGAVAALDRLGVLDSVRATEPAWPLGMRVCTERKSFLLSYNDNHGFGRRTALGIPRPVLDDILLEHARADGVRVCEHVRVMGATVQDGHVTSLQVRGAKGEEKLYARFVVGADGLHSAVARSLGLDLPVRWPRRLGLVARFQGVSGIEQFGEMHVAPGMYCGLAPVGRGMVNVGLVGALDAKRAGESVERFFERRLDSMAGVARRLKDARRVTPVRGAGPLARRVRHIAGPGFLLAGDAAGFLDPFTGEGVFRALRGAELAAAAVERALHRDDGVPEGYERARRAAFALKERVCRLVQLLLCSQRGFDHVAGQLAERQTAVDLLSGVLGDYLPARLALRPGYLWSLFGL